jgi:hypothetical protein
VSNPNPNLPTRFQPGQSGNPLGRPKGRISLTKLLTEALKDRQVNGVPNPGDKTTAECIITSLIIQAVKTGNPALYNLIFDRNDGPLPKPKAELETELDDDEPKPKRINLPRRKRANHSPPDGGDRK